MKRVQRKRTKGFRLPPNTKCINRGTDWGNPYRVKQSKAKSKWYVVNPFNVVLIIRDTKEEALEECLYMYRAYVHRRINNGTLQLSDFDGYENIACFCPTDQPCHGDEIIKLLNNKKLKS